jgi:hypothetical protein
VGSVAQLRKDRLGKLDSFDSFGPQGFRPRFMFGSNSARDRQSAAVSKRVKQQLVVSLQFLAHPALRPS